MIAPVFERLRACYGAQRWWPAEDELEIMVGAVLVQRTTWRNAASAIERLKASDALSAEQLSSLPAGTLEALIRPAGFFRVKAKRLRELGRFVVGAGGVGALQRLPTPKLRGKLLGIHGIGPETADAILGYAFERPVFVVDAYARRLFGRLAHPCAGPADAPLKRDCERALGTVSKLNELHALIVAHGKATCGVAPRCAGCCLAELCGFARDAAPSSA